MKNHRRPVSFIATDVPEQARVFFADVLGLTLRETTPFALVFEDGDHLLRVQIIPEVQPAGHTVYGWQVPDIADEIAGLNAKGVRFAMFDQLSQDALGIWATPEGHQIAWFTDPSGNILSLTQYAGGAGRN